MLLFKRVIDLQKYLKSLKNKGLDIGFAPTMGALHTGHTSLVEQAKAVCDIAVVSIFYQSNAVQRPQRFGQIPTYTRARFRIIGRSRMRCGVYARCFGGVSAWQYPLSKIRFWEARTDFGRRI